jgi:hypothetical protein
MAERRRLSRSEIESSPHTVWNAFVDLIATANYDELTET